MSRRNSEDPVVAEVRAIRVRLWREAGQTVKGFLQFLERESTSERSVQEPKRRRRKPAKHRRR